MGVSPPWRNELSEVDQQAFYISPDSDEQGTPNLSVWTVGGQYFRFQYQDGTEFHIDRQGTGVWATWPDALTLEYTAPYLLGPILGFVLRLRGITCLHASAVAVGGQAIALVGPPGAGKSTTAAAFARRGYPVLCDDVVPLQPQDNGFLARPGYPRVCIWPDSVQAVCGSPEALPLLTPNWEKCYLPLGDESHRFQQQPLPLGAVFLLGPRAAEASAPRVQAVRSGDALIALVQNTYMNYVLDRAQRAQEFELLGRLVAQVPIRQVTPHVDPAHLAKLCGVLIEEFEVVSSAALAGAPSRSA